MNHVVHRAVIHADVEDALKGLKKSNVSSEFSLFYSNTLFQQIAKGLGLRCVGWIFTDLVPLDLKTGTVQHTRHKDTYFLSAHEALTAAHLQVVKKLIITYFVFFSIALIIFIF